MTSCLGKTLKHVLLDRWQCKLKELDLYPESILGFRHKLCMQDAMLRLKEVINTATDSRDTKAILDLDLKTAFDRVKRSAILRRISELNLGKRTYNYV